MRGVPSDTAHERLPAVLQLPLTQKGLASRVHNQCSHTGPRAKEPHTGLNALLSLSETLNNFMFECDFGSGDQGDNKARL